MKDLLKDLNPEQKKAVTAPLGPVLILAGAGSGKTRALTHRIAWLIAQKKFKPENILALTFTNKAAAQMRERIEKLANLESGISNRNSKFEIRNSLTAGTFHSVCARILRSEIEKLNLGYTRNFVIYDSDDSQHLIKQITLELGLSDKIRPQVFAYYISQAKNRLVSVSDLHLPNEFTRGALLEVAERYQKRLAEMNALDFDDLLLLVSELWQKNKAVLLKYRERFQYVLVDEYQDTNHVQYILLRLLVSGHKNIFVVGDDAQSIYGFRGANMQNILDFRKDYPKARVVMLTRNYRSTAHILDAANEVIKLNPFQYEKKLWTENHSGPKVSLYEAADEVDEAKFVLKRILNLESRILNKEEIQYVPENASILDKVAKFRFRNSKFEIRNSEFDIPDNLSEIVVLYRTHAQSRAFEETFLSAGVPYQIVGGFKFYERREIKDVLSFLRMLLNPRDLVSMQRVINVPPRGVGPVTLKAIVSDFKKNNFDFTTMRGHEKAGDFFETLAIAAALPEKKSALELMELILLRSGYKDQLQRDPEGGLERWENIEELFNAAAKYKTLPWKDGLLAFLEEVALMTDLDRADETGNKLTLMTLHSAKGLEFDKVFFVGLEEGILPHSRSLLVPSEIAEEIRLAYVGITRARRELYLSYARQRQIYGELKRSVPSRIIKAIPKRLINKITN